MMLSMTKETYLSEFASQTRELIVRIVHVDPDHPMTLQDGTALFEARFDQAIDVETGEMLPPRLFNWLRWCGVKRLFGPSSPFTLHANHCYRLLVRPELENRANAQVFYVERLLEPDVKEPRLDFPTQFDAAFQKEEQERILLIKETPSSHMYFGHKGFYTPFVASIDVASDTFSPTDGMLRWLQGRHIPRFKPLSCWRVLVREDLDLPEKEWMLVKVLGKAEDARLTSFAEDYQKPVVLESELGSFRLDRKYNRFEGAMDYMGTPCDVTLEVEEGDVEAHPQLARLRALAADLPALDQRVRDFAADELMETLSDWCDEPVSREEFQKRISISWLAISPDTTVTFFFDSDNMFTDHTIVIRMDANGKFTEADLAG